ncbi:MAG: tRNA (adenosine(37)-N6)-threonylcarbamoyltransferase complex dimerization subunit type 1 TsaB [Proteobacteria bacterium]|nr:MAG: tRNA (adenosine(37)-N6)-threonylcarbamoyltransferase complex dimerization subunit type 1 TsaB [Pseudomonadota bacterium]
MKILAIDTVTESCSAALLVGGESVNRSEIARNRHSTLILPMIEAVLAEGGITLGDLDAVAFDRGPGSFTGLRIGAGVAQGVAFAADLPVCGVSSLVALAAASGRRRVLAAIDARMKQVYWALVSGTGDRMSTRAESLDDPVDVRVEAGEVHGVGSGWDVYNETLERARGGEAIGWTPGCFPQADWVARLAARMLADHGGEPPEAATPVYLRNRVTG